MYESALARQTRGLCGSPSPAVHMTDMIEVTIILFSQADLANNAVNLNTKFQIQGRDLYPIDCEGYEVQPAWSCKAEKIDASSGVSTSASSETVRTEEVVKIVHDVHRNMVAEMYETALAGQTRCPCGSLSPAAYSTDMVECKYPDFRVLQHEVCVRGLRANPPHFNCEVCQINCTDLQEGENRRISAVRRK
ncbi:hypothetical protein AgCh_016773 [Apium graveolens]